MIEKGLGHLRPLVDEGSQIVGMKVFANLERSGQFLDHTDEFGRYGGFGESFGVSEFAEFGTWLAEFAQADFTFLERQVHEIDHHLVVDRTNYSAFPVYAYSQPVPFTRSVGIRIKGL